MSHFDYTESQRISAMDFPFYALIMAAMRQADTENMKFLTAAFPRVERELRRRYKSPGGLLPDELAEEAIWDRTLGRHKGCINIR